MNVAEREREQTVKLTMQVKSKRVAQYTKITINDDDDDDYYHVDNCVSSSSCSIVVSLDPYRRILHSKLNSNL